MRTKLTRKDLEAIRSIVREEVAALRGDPPEASTAPLDDEGIDESLREDVQQTIAWMRRERPDGDEYVAAKAAWRRGELNSETRWHATRLADAKGELAWARAHKYARYIQRAERMIAKLEREVPKPYVYRPRKKR